MHVSAQLRAAVQSFQTINPSGANSTYQRLPDNRWARDKSATGTTHVQDTTRFIHPSHSTRLPHPAGGGVTYNPLEMAAATDNLVHKGGVIHKYVAGDTPGKGSVVPIPAEDISEHPIEGWTPVEHTLKPDGKVSSYHLGHPVAPFTKNSFRA